MCDGLSAANYRDSPISLTASPFLQQRGWWWNHLTSEYSDSCWPHHGTAWWTQEVSPAAPTAWGASEGKPPSPWPPGSLGRPCRSGRPTVQNPEQMRTNTCQWARDEIRTQLPLWHQKVLLFSLLRSLASPVLPWVVSPSLRWEGDKCTLTLPRGAYFTKHHGCSVTVPFMCQLGCSVKPQSRCCCEDIF